MEIKELHLLADRLLKAKDRKAELADSVKANNEQIEELEQTLVYAMVENEIPFFPYDGKRIGMMDRLYASPLSGQKEELYQLLRDNELGDIITETVHAQTLTSTVKGLLEENDNKLPGWLDGKINTYTKTGISVRKQ